MLKLPKSVQRFGGLLLLGLLLALPPAQAEEESFLRFRVFQTSALLADRAEKGEYVEGSTNVDMLTEFSGVMLTYGLLGVGQSTMTTTIDTETVQHTLNSQWLEGAMLFGVTRTTSLTLGVGLLSSAQGTAYYKSKEYTSTSTKGTSWFAIFGLEYVLPVTIDFIPLEYVEVMAGYRENKLAYDGYQSTTNEELTLNTTVNVKSVQTLLGVGLVF